MSSGPSRSSGYPQGPEEALNCTSKDIPIALGNISLDQLSIEAPSRGDVTDGPRAALEAYAAAQGHPSVEAWLRALRPPQLDRTNFEILLSLIDELSASEQNVAAELFFGFLLGMPASGHFLPLSVPRLSASPAAPADGSMHVFHPSLLTEKPLMNSPVETELHPFWGCSFLTTVST
jgi:hypothetical protein